MQSRNLPQARCGRREGEAFAPFANEAFWSGIEALELVANTNGGPPRQGTRVKMAWSTECWRLLFLIDDEEPWATLTERDAPLYEEEVVEVFFDPVGDLQAYFEIEVNPLNAVCDLALRKIRSGWRKDFAWDCERLRTRAERTAHGWQVEMEIPFTSVAAAPPQPGTIWRVNFLRIDRPPGRERELTAWSPTGIAQFHVPERFGYVEFVEFE